MISAARWRLLWWLLGVAYGILMLAGGLLPIEQLPYVPLWDKLKHLGAYLFLGFWFGSLLARARHGLLFIALFAYGALIEVLQGLLPTGRTAEWQDLVANALGIALGLALARTSLGRWPALIESRFA
jgi:VanZ family protein